MHFKYLFIKRDERDESEYVRCTVLSFIIWKDHHSAFELFLLSAYAILNSCTSCNRSNKVPNGSIIIVYSQVFVLSRLFIMFHIFLINPIKQYFGVASNHQAHGRQYGRSHQSTSKYSNFTSSILRKRRRGKGNGTNQNTITTTIE